MNDNSNMNIVFCQSRYHSNQHPIVKELQNRGHSVEYLTRHVKMSETENYEVLQPEVLGISNFSEKLGSILGISRFKQKQIEWPPVIKTYLKLKKINPDVIAVRSYSVYSLVMFFLGQIIGADCILFTQMPKYRPSQGQVIPYIDNCYRMITGNNLKQFTPVKGDPKTGVDIEYSHYIPFVIDPDYLRDINNKQYFKNEEINIISVGQYHLKRKRQIFLLDVINNIDDPEIHLTLVGHLDKENCTQYNKILNYIEENGMNDQVTVRTNIAYSNLQQLYFENDLYVIPSRDEPAAVSHLEAMAQGLPVICSDTNGTKCYIDECKNGHIFRTNSTCDLETKIQDIIYNEDRLIKMGLNSRRIVENRHMPTHFCDEFLPLINC